MAFAKTAQLTTNNIMNTPTTSNKQQATRKLINKEEFLKGNNKRRRIMSICYQLPLVKGFTRFDDNTCKRVVNFEKLDEFLCGKHSIYKKPLNYHTPEELSKVIIQFENMLKGYI